MLRHVGTHPDIDRLREFAEGRLPSNDRDAVARHLVGCPQCAENLRLSGTIIEAPIVVSPTVMEKPALPPIAKTIIEKPPLEKAARDEFETIGWAADPGTQAERPVPLASSDAEPPKELREHPRYRALRRLGGGGMGDVFLAEHTRMDRRVAIKVINRRLLDHPAALARFFQEVKTAARLEHPNIVRAYDADEAGPLHFLVMEYVEGADLAAVAKSRGKLPFDEACRLVRQAALGLQHAHEHGMVHRDIKPHNLMLTSEGQVKVLDFGLARFARETEEESFEVAGSPPQLSADGLTATGVMMGTADYIAPEQSINARDADIRADIYSLGCTLYHLIAGRPPFGGSISDKIDAHHHHLATRLSSVNPESPEALDRIVERMMAKKPADRYQTPADVITALSPFTKPLTHRRSPGLASERAPSGSKLPPSLYEGRIKLDGDKKPIHTGKSASRVPVGNGRRESRFNNVFGFLIGLAVFGVLVAAILGYNGWFGPSGEVRVIWLSEGGPLSIETLDGTRVRTVYEGTNSFRLSEGEYTVQWVQPTGEWNVDPGSFRVRSDKIITLRTMPMEEVRLKQAREAQAAEEARLKKELDAKAAAEANVAALAEARAASVAAEELAQMNRFWSGLKVVGPMGEQKFFDVPERDFRGVAVSADGNRVITCADGVVVCRRLKDGETVWRQALGKPGDRLACIATSPDGKWAAVGGASGAIHLLEESTGKRNQILAVESPVHSVCFSSDSKRLLSTHDDAARLWDMADGKPVRTFPGHDSPVLTGAFSPDDSRILTGEQNGALRLFDSADGVLLRKMTGHEGAIHGVAFSPDGATALSGGKDGTVRQWKLETGRQIRTLRGHRSPVTAVAFPPGGNLGISVGEDQAVRVWLLPLGRQFVQFDGHAGRIQCLALSKVEPLLITAGDDRSIRVWLLPNIDTGK